jgi:hypothetical protein
VSSRRRGSSTPEFRDRRRKKRQQGDLVWKNGVRVCEENRNECIINIKGFDLDKKKSWAETSSTTIGSWKKKPRCLVTQSWHFLFPSLICSTLAVWRTKSRSCPPSFRPLKVDSSHKPQHNGKSLFDSLCAFVSWWCSAHIAHFYCWFIQQIFLEYFLTISFPLLPTSFPLS